MRSTVGRDEPRWWSHAAWRARLTGALLLLAAAGPLAARAHLDPQLLREGHEVYESACVACHGPTGAGMPRTIVGFEPPSSFPDFSACDQSLPEYTRDYRATIIQGGRARGFSEIMPAFGDALNARQIDAVIVYLRSLCPDRRWAPGELNVPRALATEKAFPEDEIVVTSTVDQLNAPSVENHIISEWQFDREDQLEVDLPVNFARQEDGAVESGISDLVVGVKRVLAFNLDPTFTRGSILALQVEGTLPTGSPSRGLGTGVPQIGGFLAYDVLLPHYSYLQMQAGGDASRHPGTVPSSVFANVALGTSFPTGPYGRLWSPMVELVSNRDLAPGARTDFDLIPQMQVTLSRRQHVMASFGYRITLNDTADRPNQFMAYVLWDWLDGALTEGWR